VIRDTCATVDQKDQSQQTKSKVTTVLSEVIVQVGLKILEQHRQKLMEYGMEILLMVSGKTIRLTQLLIQTSATPNNKLACLVNSDFTVVLSKLKNVSHVGPATTVLVHQEMMLRKLAKQVCTVLEQKNNHSLVCKRTSN
jgi:S-adenosylmethionine/arginine decarboxylase-like enzyme